MTLAYSCRVHLYSGNRDCVPRVEVPRVEHLNAPGRDVPDDQQHGENTV